MCTSRGCDEHLVLHNLRESSCYINELDLVAISGDTLAGHIISTKAKIIDSLKNEYEVLCVGPLSVWPDLQHNGVGSELMIKSIEIARELGYKCMILFGNPEYYQRFGFRNAQEFGISTKDGYNFDPFMALELRPNRLESIKGRFFEDEAFVTDADKLIEFEKQFPEKKKLVTATQLKIPNP